MHLLTFWLCLIVSQLSFSGGSRPNIVLIVADDLGWDDVSFHGSDQVLTPNIDLLAYTGVALERYYSHCICTPSRSALLSSKFAHVTGMQGYPLTNGEDRGLPLTLKIMPQYFKDLGYTTRLVGKWHVGHSRTEYLPMSRGFDSHFGHRGGYIDYYEYLLMENWSIGEVSGLDLYRNMTPAWDEKGYVTDLYNEEAKSIIKSHDKAQPLFLVVAHNAPHCANEGAPLQAPPEDVRAMRHVESPKRRIYSAMVKKLDDSVGDIVKALHDKGILDNTIIAFISDNGGITSGSSVNYASNYPLRGLKLTPFEGGIRVNGLVWSRNLTGANHLWKGYMHIVDWMPTLIRAVGSDPPTNIDGIDLWDNIISNKPSKRNDIFEIDDYTGFASIIHGDFKLIAGNVLTNYSNHQGKDFRGMIGHPPSYVDAIKRSKIYSVIRDMEIPFTFNDTNLRNDIKIDCRTKEIYKDVEICYPKNGKHCVFNIKEDPCETKDLSDSQPDVAKELYSRLQVEIIRTIRRRVPLHRDLRAAPSLHNYTWTTWANGISS
ncbi:arylsulfatase I-like isoform X1 [Colias croceus]|uniref:arylsulfatase I-like isoform X1 n=2 Tax=Colias crocea TaxID=72248 RepID=UPI001E27CE6D|nr:arylsulfatase I-like isoform X1 [Colias croceus]